MIKRFALASVFVAVLLVGCGTEDAAEPESPEPAATEEADTGETTDDMDLDY